MILSPVPAHLTESPPHQTFQQSQTRAAHPLIPLPLALMFIIRVAHACAFLLITA